MRFAPTIILIPLRSMRACAAYGGTYILIVVKHYKQLLQVYKSPLDGPTKARQKDRTKPVPTYTQPRFRLFGTRTSVYAAQTAEAVTTTSSLRSRPGVDGTPLSSTVPTASSPNSALMPSRLNPFVSGKTKYITAVNTAVLTTKTAGVSSSTRNFGRLEALTEVELVANFGDCGG